MLTAERLRELLSYDPETGVFVRLSSGLRVGCLMANGYLAISADGRTYLAQTLAWLAMVGAFPERRLTFRNGDRIDCRWVNLRATGPEPRLTAERVREILDYDQVTGRLTYRKNRGRLRRAGDTAGTISKKSLSNGGGYRVISIEGREYGAHRLAWLHVHGKWPKAKLDHINRIRDDNRLANLREATHAQNMANRGLQANSSSGFKGVSFMSRIGKWRASIQRRHLGLFSTAREAHEAYAAEALKLFGGFACDGTSDLGCAPAVTPALAGAA